MDVVIRHHFLIIFRLVSGLVHPEIWGCHFVAWFKGCERNSTDLCIAHYLVSRPGLKCRKARAINL
jgi:hypothetical protein